MKLVVGLGNPGREYARSRHNAGFMVVDHLAQGHAIRFNERRAHSLAGRGTVGGAEIMLAKPRTFMNHSGRAVQGLLMAHGLRPAQVLVVYDDFDLPLGTLRLRRRGSAGTHNGMRSIVDALGTESFPRLRIGIGAARGATAHDYVLSEFDAESWVVFEETRDRAVQAIESVLADDLDSAMNRFNT
jgi:PTH1 family peptidyl-tRNA hydrolase